MWGYVALGWAIAAVLLGGYVVALLWRGRRLIEQVPEGERRWL